MDKTLKRWEPWEFVVLNTDYPLRGPHFVAQKLGRTKRSIMHKVSRLGIAAGEWRDRCSAESTTIDALYFSKDWNEEMAWIAGYLHADANITFGEASYAIQLDCHRSDEELVWHIKSAFKSDHKVSYEELQIDEYGSHGPSVRCSFTNKILVRDLIAKTGLCPGKSYVDLRMHESVPKDLQHHYLRGLFDGDGWVTPADLSAGFTGSASLMQQIVDILSEQGMKLKKVEKNGKSDINKKNKMARNKRLAITLQLFLSDSGFLFKEEKTWL